MLNARTDAFALNRDRRQGENLANAIERGKAYLDAGAPVVFVPAILSEDEILQLVDAFGPHRLTTIGIPGTPRRDWQQEHGVARTSYGPLSQNVALTALQELVEEVHRGGGVPQPPHPELTLISRTSYVGGPMSRLSYDVPAGV